VVVPQGRGSHRAGHLGGDAYLTALDRTSG
jgi:hypothetical protein